MDYSAHVLSWESLALEKAEGLVVLGGVSSIKLEHRFPRFLENVLPVLALLNRFFPWKECPLAGPRRRRQ